MTRPDLGAPLTGAEAAALDAALAAAPGEALGYHELRGFLFAMVSCPDLVPPSDWLPFVFGEEDPGFANQHEADRILQLLMKVYNEINTVGGMESGPALVGAPMPTAAEATVLPDDHPLRGWSRGFAEGHAWLEDSWDAVVGAMPDGSEEVGALLMVLSVFASAELARDLHAEAAADAPLEEYLDTMLRLFPQAAAEYFTIGRRAGGASVPPTRGAPTPGPIRVDRPAGRNDPCPCGSGRKFKRCCGATTH